MPTYLHTYVRTYLPTYLFTFLPTITTYLPTYPPTYLPTYLYTYRPTCQPTYLQTKIFAVQGLGPTVPEIELAKFGITPYSKTCFTMCLPDLMGALREVQPETKSIVLCGIETHACIHHTTLDRLEAGFEVRSY